MRPLGTIMGHFSDKSHKKTFFYASPQWVFKVQTQLCSFRIMLLNISSHMATSVDSQVQMWMEIPEPLSTPPKSQILKQDCYKLFNFTLHWPDRWSPELNPIHKPLLCPMTVQQLPVFFILQSKSITSAAIPDCSETSTRVKSLKWETRPSQTTCQWPYHDRRTSSAQLKFIATIPNQKGGMEL